MKMSVNKTMLILMTIVMVLGVGCKKKNPYSHLLDRPLPVEIEVAGQTQRFVENTYVGEIRPSVDIPLIFPMGGQITGLYVKSGDRVKKNQLIATVDSTQAKSLMESAQAMYAQAQDAYNRLKPLHEKGGISDVKWVEMETNLEKARSMARSTKKRFDDCQMRAIQDGIVNMKNVEVGQYVGLAQPIGNLMDLNGFEADFTVPENEVGLLRVGQPVKIILPALGTEYEAKLVEKSLIATHLAHTYRVKAAITSNEAAKDLLPGMVCRACIRELEGEGVIISAGCVQTQQRGHSVWVLRDGKAERTMIKIAAFVENGVLVSEGLQVGDTVVSKGYQKMYTGARVSF